MINPQAADHWQPAPGQEIDLPRLRQEMAATFTLGNLRVISFDLQFVYENLPFKHETRDEVSLALVEKCQQADRLGELITKCLNLRPKIPWDQFTRTISPEASPYKGLEPFGVGDAELFFGREELTAQLVAHIREHSFLAVLGASGSGKSSLVLAGLIPALKRDGHDWPVYIVKPTSQPLASLARELTRETESERAALILQDDLAADSRVLSSKINRLAGQASAPHVLLVVDQFEELFTLCRNEKERQALIDNLTVGLSAPDASYMKLVLTLRADFYHHCAQYDMLRQLLQDRQQYIGQMSSQELRRAIEKPAENHDLILEPGLVEMLLQDLGAVDSRRPEPGALPYFSHALLETWRRRQGKVMTVAGYAVSGGVRGAVAETAESAYQGLTDEQQVIARSILLRLVKVEEGVPDTRRRARLAELLPQDEAGRRAVEVVLDSLSKQRLITLDRDEIEVAHEALIRRWPRFREWIEQDREGLRIHRQLTDAALIWEKMGRPGDIGELYRGKRLADAINWFQTQSPVLSELEGAFLKTSQQTVEEENHRRQEAALQRQVAEGQRRIIQTLSLAEKAPNIAGQNQQTELATLLALEAARLNDEGGQRMNWLVDRALRAVLSQPNFSNILVPDRPKTVRFAGYSDDGRWLITVDLDGNVNRRDLSTGRSQRIFVGGDVDQDRDWILSPNGCLLAKVYQDRFVRIRVLSKNPTDHILERERDSRVFRMAFSADARQLAAVGQTDIQLWNLDPVAKMPAAQLSGAPLAEEAVFSPDGRWLAAYGGYGPAEIYLWDLKSGEEDPLWLWSHEKSFEPPLFSPDSRYLVTTAGYEPAVIQLRDLEILNEDPLWQTTYEVSAGGAAFSRDGRQLAISGEDAMILFDMTQPGRTPTKLATDMAFDDVAFSPLGTWLAATNRLGYINWWLFPSLDSRLGAQDFLGSYIQSLAFSPDGQWVMAADSNALIHLWQPESSLGLLESYINLKGHAFYLFDLTFSQDSRRMISHGHDPLIRLWHLDKPVAEPRQFPGGEASWSLAISADGRWLAAGQENGQVVLWPFSDPSPTCLARHQEAVNAVAFSPDGELLASGDDSGQLFVWKLGRSEDELISLPGRGGRITTVAFSKFGRWLAAAGGDQGIRLWTTDRLESAPLLLGTDTNIMALDFSNDNRWLASVTTSGAVRMFDLERPEREPLTLREQYSPTGAAVFSPDGRWLATGGTDREVTLWPLDEPDTSPLVLHRQQGYVNGISFSQDGLWMATGCEEGPVRLWDMADLTAEPALLSGHSGPVRDVAISPDSRWLVSAGVDGRILRWPLLKKLVEDAKQLVMRSLTEEERRRYLPGE